MRAVALVVSARQHGNCRRFAEFVLQRLETAGMETELVNFYDYEVKPCAKCSYECVSGRDRETGRRAPGGDCPVRDDVPGIWRRLWAADVLLVLVPTYGGAPPALWFCFSQRLQCLWQEGKRAWNPRQVAGFVVLTSPHRSSGADFTVAFLENEAGYFARQGVRIAGFEVIDMSACELDALTDDLLRAEEIRRRLGWLAERLLRASG